MSEITPLTNMRLPCQNDVIDPSLSLLQEGRIDSEEIPRAVCGLRFVGPLLMGAGEMAFTFGEQLTITIIDKGVFGLLLVAAGFVFNHTIEKLRFEQTKTIDDLKTDQAKMIEALKSDLTGNLELNRERRTAVADFAKKMSVGYQAMSWLAWKPKYSPKSLSKTDIVTYNDDMKRAFPEIAAARVLANSLGGGVTKRLADQLVKLDSELAGLCDKYLEAHDDHSRSATAKEMGDMHERIRDAYEAFVNEISKLAAAPQSLQPDD